MNWQHFQTYNESVTLAFETMCNQLFKQWVKTEYCESIMSINIVNGTGGDGGVESYATLSDGSIIGMQAKWFLTSMTQSQINQIKKSIETAISVRPKISKYIVSIPRNLSSEKKVKKGKTATNTEDSRWTKMKTELENKLSGLSIELWSEINLLEHLQSPVSSGIYRYWFEKSEISDELISYSYEKQKKGWLSLKYTPSLHKSGLIFERLNLFFGNIDDRTSVINELRYCIIMINTLRDACDEYRSFNLEDSLRISIPKEIIDAIDDLYPKLTDAISELDICIQAIENEFALETINFNKLLDLNTILLCKPESQNQLSIDIIKAVQSINDYNIYQLINKIKEQLSSGYCIITGEPGTGKTHGIANTVETYIANGLHIPLMIKTKDYNPNDNWSGIITKVLGMSQQWNELEIWQALEALSFMHEISNLHNKKLLVSKIIPKVILFLEGLDESRPYKQWFDRIKEFEYIQSKFPRIKLCITSRPFVFREFAKSLTGNWIYLPSDGDVSVSELFDIYINHFDINIGKQTWIRRSLRTPLALRLFCEIYKNNNNLSLERSSVTITNLISKKISIIDEEFYSKSDIENRHKTIIKNSLIKISDLFLDNREVSLSELLTALEDISDIASSDIRMKVVNFIEEYGLIQSYVENEKSLFKSQKIYYVLGIETIFDYLFALRIFESAKTPDKICIKPNTVYAEGSLQLLSVLLLEEYKYLISKNRSIKEYLDEKQLFELVCFALANASPLAALDYKLVVERMMRQPTYLKETINRVLIPVARMEDHPFSMLMLHEYLSSFDLPAQRDVIWSIPNFTYGYDYSWSSGNFIDLDKDFMNLEQSDTAIGLPLLYAWLLTSVDNSIRVKCRSRLVLWACQCPSEFFVLFKTTILTNDLQMKEDLYSVLMGLVFTNRSDKELISEICKWLIENLYAVEVISQNYSVAIRYYASSIMKYAFSIGCCSDSDIELCTPPYKVTGTLNLSKEAIKGTRMGGFGPIDYDLSRYVLCDFITHRFFCRLRVQCPEPSNSFTDEDTQKMVPDEFMLSGMDSLIKMYKGNFQNDVATISTKNKVEKGDEGDVIFKYNKLADDLLQRHARMIGVEELSSEQFILSAAYAYIIAQGWNPEDFYGKPNGRKLDEKKGVDVLISREYHSATHGQKSPVMRFSEKYTWCARNEIIGYLSDCLLYSDFGDNARMLDDYGLIDDFPNAAQEVFQYDPEKLMKDCECFIPENLTPNIECPNGANGIKDWVISAPVPDFGKCLYIKAPQSYNLNTENQEWLCLYNYNNFKNNQGGESIMWTSSAIIDRDRFQWFLNDIKIRCSSIIEEFMNPVELYSVTESNCYLSPKEICWFVWKNNLNHRIENRACQNGEKYSIIKAVEECVSNSITYGDIYFRMPSKDIRQYLSINDGNGYKYYDTNGNVVSIFFESGDKWDDSQSYLCVDKSIFLSQLNQREQMIFWVVRLLRKPSSNALEIYPRVLHERDRCWLIWFDENERLHIECFSDEVIGYQ